MRKSAETLYNAAFSWFNVAIPIIKPIIISNILIKLKLAE